MRPSIKKEGKTDEAEQERYSYYPDISVCDIIELFVQ
jgi:hypothetical protein